MRLVTLAGLAVFGLAVIFVSSPVAQGPTPLPSVWLQSGSPGTAQAGHSNINGVSIAGLFQGSGASLFGLNASNVSTGTLSDARLSSNVALLNTVQTFAAAHTFGGGLSTTGFNLTTAPAAGKVLTSDASGIGTWQNATGLTLPYTGSVNASQPAFRITNTTVSGGTAIEGTSVSPFGTGLFGAATDTSSTINYGVFGISYSPIGHGVWGQGVTGVTGHTTANGGTAVLGNAYNASSTNYGVEGRTNSTTGRGVYGYAYATTGTNYGVYGESDSGSGRGVRGSAGDATAGTVPYGVYGQVFTATNGYAVYASGDMGAAGTKPFRIDHPFDPLNKYLLHYASEGPVPQNVYNGVVTTDSQGFAWVDLPDYFEEINKDFRYQLTCIGAFAQAIVAKKVVGGRFLIQTDKPNVEVSWEVKGTRNDAYCRYKQPKDVMEKVGVERGKYQIPEIYGAPAEMGMGYESKAGHRK